VTIPLAQRFSILQRDQFTCRFCGRRASETELEVDHLTPRSRGGSDDLDNLVTTCRNCNRGKSDRTVVLPAPNTWTSLVGKFFHTFDQDDWKVAGQGVVLSEVTPGTFVVQTFEWITGHPAFYGIQLATLAEMIATKWSFYENHELMQDAYRYGGRARRWPKGEDPPEAGPAVELADVAERLGLTKEAPR
jgi:hypothetical protein